jgi:hypothetical protein
MSMDKRLETLMYLHIIGGLYLLATGPALFQTLLLFQILYITFGILNLYVVWKIWYAQIGESTWIASLLGIAFGLGSTLLLLLLVGLSEPTTIPENGIGAIERVTRILTFVYPGFIIFLVQAYKFYLDLPILRSQKE